MGLLPEFEKGRLHQVLEDPTSCVSDLCKEASVSVPTIGYTGNRRDVGTVPGRAWTYRYRSAINSRGLVFSTHFASLYSFRNSTASGSLSSASYRFIKTKEDPTPHAPPLPI